MYTNVSEPKTAAVSSQNTALAGALSTFSVKMLSGDEAAFEAFYDTSKNYVCNNIKGLFSSLPDDTVGDIMQEVYIKVFSNISSLNTPEGTLKWLKTITVNTARDYFRKSCVRHESLIAEEEEATFESLAAKSALISPVKNPEDIAQETETRRLVADALLDTEAGLYLKKWPKGGIRLQAFWHSHMSIQNPAVSAQSLKITYSKKGTGLRKTNSPVPFLFCVLDQIFRSDHLVLKAIMQQPLRSCSALRTSGYPG